MTPRLYPIADLETMRAAIRGGIDVEYVQLEAADFQGWWSVAPVAGLEVQIGGADVSLVRRVKMPADVWLVVVPLKMPGSARWNGATVSGGEIITVPPGSRTYAFDPRGSRYAVVALDHAAVAQMGETVLEGRSSAAIVAKPARSEWRILYGVLARAVDLSASADYAEGALAERGRADLLAALADCLKSAAVPVSKRSSASIAIVARSEDFAHTHSGESVTIAQLSAASGVSERSLRNAFYEVCAVGPKRYLRIRSLHNVRRALTTGAVGSSVTHVATLHGFFELGRFAGEYKALFGEAPSQTLQKTRARMASVRLPGVGRLSGS
jgi:AraC family ethanolamine operon transcriptional activator